MKTKIPSNNIRYTCIPTITHIHVCNCIPTYHLYVYEAKHRRMCPYSIHEEQQDLLNGVNQ